MNLAALGAQLSAHRLATAGGSSGSGGARFLCCVSPAPDSPRAPAPVPGSLQNCHRQQYGQVWPFASCLAPRSRVTRRVNLGQQKSRGDTDFSRLPRKPGRGIYQNTLSDPRYSTAVVLGPDCTLGHQGGLKKKVMAGLHPDQ